MMKMYRHLGVLNDFYKDEKNENDEKIAIHDEKVNVSKTLL